jgi:hypothetical protein
METLKEQKPDTEIVQAVDVELNEEQLNIVAGGGLPDFTLMATTVEQIVKYEREG